MLPLSCPPSQQEQSCCLYKKIMPEFYQNTHGRFLLDMAKKKRRKKKQRTNQALPHLLLVKFQQLQFYTSRFIATRIRLLFFNSKLNVISAAFYIMQSLIIYKKKNQCKAIIISIRIRWMPCKKIASRICTGFWFQLAMHKKRLCNFVALYWVILDNIRYKRILAFNLIKSNILGTQIKQNLKW